VILNFEIQIGDVLWDCDADVTFLGEALVARLLEVRRVNDDGEGFTLVRVEDLPADLRSELEKHALAEREAQLETRAERLGGA
jgi:hypothetical protein